MIFLDPRHVVRQFGVYGRDEVADFGAGSGYLSLAAAERLDGGKLYAIDVDKEILARLAADAQHLGHDHVHTLAGDIACIGGVPLKENSVDKVIASNVLFQVDDRDAFIQEIDRVLRDEGKVLVIDWSDNHNLGPRDSHKVSRDDIVDHFTRHGFTCEKDIDAGECHYGMILSRN